MSEDAPAVPTPWVLDSSVLVEVARGDTGTMTFIQELDARGRPLVIPALAVTGASLDMRSGEAAELLEGLERLKNAMTAALRDAEQAVRLAAVIASTGLDPWDAHVAAVADAAVCPILTLNGAKWREHAADLAPPRRPGGPARRPGPSPGTAHDPALRHGCRLQPLAGWHSWLTSRISGTQGRHRACGAVRPTPAPVRPAAWADAPGRCRLRDPALYRSRAAGN